MEFEEGIPEEVLARDAIIFSAKAQTILAHAELAAMDYPIINGVIWAAINPTLNVVLDKNRTFLVIDQYDHDAMNPREKNLPKLPNIHNVSLKGPRILPKLKLGLSQIETDEVQGYTLVFRYQHDEALKTSQAILAGIITPNNGRIILACLGYYFDQDGFYGKYIDIEGTDDFMDPSLMDRVGKSNLGNFHKTGLTIRAVDVEFVGFALKTIEEKIFK